MKMVGRHIVARPKVGFRASVQRKELRASSASMGTPEGLWTGQRARGSQKRSGMSWSQAMSTPPLGRLRNTVDPVTNELGTTIFGRRLRS
mmetsp:Transcript_9501/g.22379  ORF Transcript_9501/g.22379 Transcript_9501/m.22379 type:complete len:90 (+) Transcript_9501:454-723(+)